MVDRLERTMGATGRRRAFEDVLGGTGLAWLGGVTVLVGLAFLLTMAVSRGWLGEGARTALGGGGSLALLRPGRPPRGGGPAAALAVRGRAPLMGWLGLCGALLAPAVVGGDGAIAYLAVAFAAT